MTPLYTKQYEDPDGAIMQTSWGYCREQNAVRLGYAVNILAALVGLILVFLRAKQGLWVCLFVGASFGAAYFFEQAGPIHIKKPLFTLSLHWFSVFFTLCAYLPILMLALGV